MRCVAIGIVDTLHRSCESLQCTPWPLFALSAHSMRSRWPIGLHTGYESWCDRCSPCCDYMETYFMAVDMSFGVS
eukprot:6456479-Prymnesium_polylepis.2